MPILVTFKKTAGLDETFEALWDDATMDRFLAWAKRAYPSAPDGNGVVQPTTNRQACRRNAREYLKNIDQAIRNSEKQASIDALPPPPPVGPELPT